MKARPINDLAEANDTFGRIFAALLLLNLAILSINFFIALMNDALERQRTPLRKMNYTNSWMNTTGRVHKRARFFLMRLVRVYTELKSMKHQPELNSRNGTTINCDLITQTTKNDRKQRIHTSGNEKPNSTRRE